MYSFDQTAYMAILFGAIGGVASHGIWMEAVGRKAAEANKLVSKAKSQQYARMRLFLVTIGIGAVLGFPVGVAGFYSNQSIGAICGLAFLAGLSSKAISKILGKIS